MKKKLALTLLVLTLVGAIAGFATTAQAFPSKTRACSGCHGTSSAVKITLTRKSSTATTVTYAIKVTGGSGTAGWAVLKGSTNVKHRTASTGTFTIKKHVTYKVWAVKKGSGARYKTVTPS